MDDSAASRFALAQTAPDRGSRQGVPQGEVQRAEVATAVGCQGRRYATGCYVSACYNIDVK